MSELKPCPFCGERKELDFEILPQTNGKHLHYISCGNCETDGPAGSLSNKQAAILWNQRLTPVKDNTIAEGV